jgi:hypothetical protein
MAVNFETTEPHRLLAAFKKAIDDKKVLTWSYDSDGDFTHTPDQWKYKAWLRPRTPSGNRLTLNILGRKEETMPLEVYSVYHGRFIEAMIAHCRTLFAAGSASSKPTSDDVARVA